MKIKNISLIISLILLCQFTHGQNYPQKVLTDCDSHCKKEWTKRGVLNERLYNYCIEREKAGYDKMRELEQKYTSFTWVEKLKNDIITYWTKAGVTEWQMVGFSLEKEIDAYLDIDYGLKNGEFKKDDYNACFSKWKEARPESVWTMTRYCLKNPRNVNRTK